MEQNKHIADFSNCNYCRNKNTKEVDEPCHTCLETEYVDNTHYPINYDGPRPEPTRRKREYE